MKNKIFLLPWSVMIGDSLSDYFSSRGVEVNIIKTVPSDSFRISRRELGDEIRNRDLRKNAIEGLELMRRYLDEVRYSGRTNGSYRGTTSTSFYYG